MGFKWVLAGMAGVGAALAVALAGGSPVYAASQGPLWGAPKEVVLPSGAHGANAPAPNPMVAINSVSCWSAGNCAAVGTYDISMSGGAVPAALLLMELKHVWQPSVEGLDPAGDQTALTSVSCVAGGDCIAVGSEPTGNLPDYFTATAGVWSQAGRTVSLPPNAIPVGAQLAPLNAVSCASASHCVAVGDYAEAGTAYQAGSTTYPNTEAMFASGSITGLSQAAQVTPPKDSAPDGNTIGAQQHLYLSSVSCATTGECAATGDYFTSTNADAGMFVEGAGGTLGSQGYRLPVLGHPRSVSCAAGGACAAAVGSSGLLGQTTPYDPSHPATTGWQLESPSAPSPYGASVFNAADCFAAGACAAVGQTDTSNSPMFGWDESGGAWQSPGKYMPPPANGDAGSASPTVVGCASAGNCSAFGGYNVAGNPYGFVANEVDGTWKQATTLPPPAGGYSDTSGITSISCADVGDCTAVGSYTTTGSSGIGEGFVVDGRTTSSGTTSTGGTTTQPPGGGSAGTAHAGAPHASGTTVSISISCSGAGACTVKLKLTATETLKGSKVIALTARAKKHKKVVVLGRAIATIPGGHTAIAKVSLNSLGKRLLKQRKALPLTLTITQRTTRIATDHLRLKRR